ncbi:COMM domain-containing protein 10-like [Daphnia carinata]|uniref:COMM domain-containing protein 10-like n=1 Tax=Daphnia carinata TaxID=120202 RepID=UPI00257BCA4D|nr:COMM domain-containing protein 10-like [Daphnia carinata]
MSASNSTPMLRVMPQSIELINGINSAFLSNILLLIIKRLSEEQKGSQIFSQEEKLKLKELLSLHEDSTLEIVLSTLEHIIRHAAFHVMRPSNLSKYVSELGFYEQVGSLISELWAVHAKSVIDMLKKETCAHLKVEHIESSIHCSLSSLKGGHTELPLALVHFNLNGAYITNETADDRLRSTNDSYKSTLSLEFNREELAEFYQMLETVQSHLDDLL